MKRLMLTSLLTWIMLLTATGIAEAGSQLSIRLIHASNSASGGSPAPSDIANVLKRSLPYKHFSLQGSTSISIPAGGSRTLKSYSITCKGEQSNMLITVKGGGRTLVNTKVTLKDGKPFIVGGLPSKGGKEILVFVAK